MTLKDRNNEGNMLIRFKSFASAVSSLSLALVFLLFIYGIGMRHIFDRPIGWIDEAVTVLSVWSVLWTAAFVLRWHEHISFDIVFVNVTPARQRLMLLVGGSALVVLMGAAMPGMIDYTLFLWRERTDMLGMRLDMVYAIYPLFFAVILMRLLTSLWRLLRPCWRDELRMWTGESAEVKP